MTRYQVLDNNKPAQYPYCNVSPSWNKSIYDSWEEAHEYAQKWLAIYAPENYKFEVQEKLPKTAANLNQNQKEFLAGILKLIEQKKWKGEDLHTKIHEIRQKMNLDPRQAFSAIYIIFIGKDSGPQAGWFLTSLDRDFVIKRLKEVLKT